MKGVLMVIGGVALIALLMVAVGCLLPVKHRGQGAITVSASPERVFGLISNVEGFTTWRSRLKSAERVTLSDAKLRFREISGDGSILYVVEAIEAPRRLVVRIDDKSLPFGGTWTYEVTPIGAGRTKLQITEDGEIYNPLFRFMSRYILGYERTIHRYEADVAKALGMGS